MIKLQGNMSLLGWDERLTLSLISASGTLVYFGHHFLSRDCQAPKDPPVFFECCHIQFHSKAVCQPQKPKKIRLHVNQVSKAKLVLFKGIVVKACWFIWFQIMLPFLLGTDMAGL